MMQDTIKLLFIESQSGFNKVLKSFLSKEKEKAIEMQVVSSLTEGMERLADGHFDLMLVELASSDGVLVDRVLFQAPKVPLIVLADEKDEPFALAAVRKGAQDYLLKNSLSLQNLLRVCQCAVLRHDMLSELKVLAITDPLTGLHNRRSFFHLAEQQLKFSVRTKKELCLLFVDLDRMKWINDRFGHSKGDTALMEVARLLKHTFRESDIVARMGGDEFAVLAIDAKKENIENLTNRIKENLKRLNDLKKLEFDLSISYGASVFDPSDPISIAQLLAEADESMYAHKVRKIKA